MKSFCITEAPSEKFVELAIAKMGGNPNDFRHMDHPQEDFFMISEKYPIYVVADGVTLIQYIYDKENYPNPSPAGDVARIFCQEFVKAAEAKYESFKESDFRDFFIQANRAVEKYNNDNGRTRESIDFWMNDLYAATVAFVVIKDNKAYWGSICDSYVMHFDQNGELKYSSPKCNDLKQAEAVKFSGDPTDRKAKIKYNWSTLRNGIDSEGRRVGYGVVTGESAAEKYLSTGTFEIKKGDLVTVLTDGFEDYIKIADFVSFFVSWHSDLELQVRNFNNKKAEEDPERFGRERTMVVICND